MPIPFDLAAFEHFQDDPASPFHAAPGLTPQETWREVIVGMTAALEAAVAQIRSRRPVTLESVAASHRLIFESTFPADAGRFRGFRETGEPEEVWFGIRVGAVGSSRLRPTKGAHPNRIADQLGGACLEFSSEVHRLQHEPVVALRDATPVCARLYAKVARIHPFVDGNLRAAFVVLQVALGSLDLPLIAFPELEEHDRALEQALRVDADQSYAPMAALIEKVVRAS